MEDKDKLKAALLVELIKILGKDAVSKLVGHDEAGEGETAAEEAAETPEDEAKEMVAEKPDLAVISVEPDSESASEDAGEAPGDEEDEKAKRLKKLKALAEE